MLTVEFRVATPADEDTIGELFRGTPMTEGGNSIWVSWIGGALSAIEQDRGTSRFKAFVSLNENCKAQAFASTTFYARDQASRLGIAGVKEVAYLADLRIKPGASRKLRLSWRNWYENWIQYLIRTHPACSLVTSILDSNTMALRAFRSDRNGFEYQPIFPYTTYTFLGRADVGGTGSFRVDTDRLESGTRYTIFQGNKMIAVADLSKQLARRWVLKEAGSSDSELSVRPRVFRSIRLEKQIPFLDSALADEIIGILVRTALDEPEFRDDAVQIALPGKKRVIFPPSQTGSGACVQTDATLYAVHLKNSQAVSLPGLDSQCLCMDLSLL